MLLDLIGACTAAAILAASGSTATPTRSWRWASFRAWPAHVCFGIRKKRLVCNVPGDDLTTAGQGTQLNWFEAELARKYELAKGGQMGPGAEDNKEGRVLNRIDRWTGKGLEYEADPRQVERMLADLELVGEDVEFAVTPGVKPLADELAKD